MSDNGREPLGRTIASDASVRRDVTAQRPSLRERRPRHSSAPVGGWTPPTLPRKKKGEAEPTRPGRVVRWAARQRRTLASGDVVLPTGGGDRQIADCSAANLGTTESRKLSGSIWVICGLCDGRATLRWLRVFVSSCLRCLALCFSLCSLCLCGFMSRLRDTPAGTWRKTPLPVRAG